jgi:hypothetical protein
MKLRHEREMTSLHPSSSLGKSSMPLNQLFGLPVHVFGAINQDERLWRHGSLIWVRMQRHLQCIASIFSAADLFLTRSQSFHDPAIAVAGKTEDDRQFSLN